MSPHGAILVDAENRRWRAFAPGWRLWLWLGFLIRRVTVARLPGRLLPFVGWVPAPRIEVKFGMPPRCVAVRAERVEPSKFHRVARARFRRWVANRWG